MTECCICYKILNRRDDDAYMCLNGNCPLYVCESCYDDLDVCQGCSQYNCVNCQITFKYCEICRDVIYCKNCCEKGFTTCFECCKILCDKCFEICKHCVLCKKNSTYNLCVGCLNEIEIIFGDLGNIISNYL